MPNGEADPQVQPSPRAPDKATSLKSAAHEIKNPLDSLLTLLHLLEGESTMTEKGAHYLRLAQDEVRRVAQIAQDVLSDHNVLAPVEDTNVSELFAAVLDVYKQRCDSSEITVQTEYSDDGNIAAYAGQLRQLFSNILVNAIESMPEGGKIHARVYTGHEWCGQQRRGVRVTVADNGCGIPSTMMPQLFQRRFTMKSNGHGMGLSLVKEIVQHHKGMVRVRSSTQAARHGTVFTLFLPAA